MSFDRNWPNRKDHRKPYRKAARFARSCRNHGSCGHCKNNRTYFDRHHREGADRELYDYLFRPDVEGNA